MYLYSVNYFHVIIRSGDCKLCCQLLQYEMLTVVGWLVGWLAGWLVGWCSMFQTSFNKGETHEFTQRFVMFTWFYLISNNFMNFKINEIDLYS